MSNAGDISDSSSGLPVPFWARPWFVLSAIALYLAVHFAIRMTMGPALSVDDADQTLFSQFFAWAYRYKAPPLFVWLLATITSVIPAGALATALLRYAFLGVTFVAAFFVARRLIADPRLAALAVYSFAAINTFAEASHRNLAHTTAMAAFLALAWYVFVRLAASPRLAWYLALGAVFGLGLLSKWNFLLFAIALPAACLFFPQGRPLVLNWRTIAAALVAAALILPTLKATIEMGVLPEESVGEVLGTAGGAHPARVVIGTSRLLETALVYSLPLLPIALIVFTRPLWRGLSRPAEARVQFPGTALVGATIAIGLGLCWALVLFMGATTFRVRYLYPALFILPVFLFMVIERGRPSPRAVNLFAVTMAALAMFVGVKRVATVHTPLLSCGLCIEERPYGALADQLRHAGYEGGGTILSSDLTAGNLYAQFPRARVIDPTYPSAAWPEPEGEGQCLLVSEVYNEDLRRSLAHFEGYLGEVLGGHFDAPHRDGLVSAPMLPPAEGSFALGYRLYEGPNGACR
jgi:4-amino-4-deoxy-L-arabinose transferase-like glycosyltransferase